MAQITMSLRLHLTLQWPWQWLLATWTTPPSGGYDNDHGKGKDNRDAYGVLSARLVALMAMFALDFLLARRACCAQNL